MAPQVPWAPRERLGNVLPPVVAPWDHPVHEVCLARLGPEAYLESRVCLDPKV